MLLSLLEVLVDGVGLSDQVINNSYRISTQILKSFIFLRERGENFLPSISAVERLETSYLTSTPNPRVRIVFCLL